jgi:TonB family protein
MFETLIESRLPRQRSTPASVVSFAVHGVLIAGLVHLTPLPVSPLGPERIVTIEGLPVAAGGGGAPAARTGEGSQIPARPRLLLRSGPVVLEVPCPPGTLVPGAVVDWAGPPGREPSLDSLAALPGSGGDSPPALLAVQPPRYPPGLRAAGVAGRVTLDFVVDSMGRAEAAGLRVEVADNPGFVDAAVEAVLASRFRPAMSGGHPVAVRVRQVVRFALER